MKHLLLFVFTTCLLASCGGSKPRVITTKKQQEQQEAKIIIGTAKDAKETGDVVSVKKTKEDQRASKITDYALKFKGTPYKFGGTTKHGMDCSGLVYAAFLEQGFTLPRTSRAMSLEGKRLNLDEVDNGDLLFFETNKNKKVINHVGLVVGFNNENILFIHSTSSKGVLISNFSEPYWREAFVMARRVL